MSYKVDVRETLGGKWRFYGESEKQLEVAGIAVCEMLDQASGRYHSARILNQNGKEMLILDARDTKYDIIRLQKKIDGQKNANGKGGFGSTKENRK